MNMDTQQAFETVVKHLRKQGCRSQQDTTVNGTITCMYRIPENGLMCAVGALIPDEVYQESFEGTAIRRLLRDEPAVNELFRKVNMNLLEDLQEVHDKQAVEDWEDAFERLATAYRLTMPSKGE
jgi:hypothetical protein